MSDAKSQSEFLGWIYGFIGVVIFSLTLPATRLAVSELDPVSEPLTLTTLGFAGGVIICVALGKRV